jgi:ketosteroid isomerase-like protein
VSESVELLKRGYAAFNRGDVDAVFELLDPEIEWVNDERVPFAGTYRGHDELRALLRDQQEVFGEVTMEPYEFFEAGDRIVAFVRLRAQDCGKRGRDRDHDRPPVDDPERQGRTLAGISGAREGARGGGPPGAPIAPFRG